jgi:hypothetical protein
VEEQQRLFRRRVIMRVMDGHDVGPLPACSRTLFTVSHTAPQRRCDTVRAVIRYRKGSSRIGWCSRESEQWVKGLPPPPPPLPPPPRVNAVIVSPVSRACVVGSSIQAASTLTVRPQVSSLRCRAQLWARVSPGYTDAYSACAGRCAFSAPSARAIPSLPAARAILPRNVW